MCAASIRHLQRLDPGLQNWRKCDACREALASLLRTILSSFTTFLLQNLAHACTRKTCHWRRSLLLSKAYPLCRCLNNWHPTYTKPFGFFITHQIRYDSIYLSIFFYFFFAVMFLSCSSHGKRCALPFHYVNAGPVQTQS